MRTAVCSREGVGCALLGPASHRKPSVLVCVSMAPPAVLLASVTRSLHMLVFSAATQNSYGDGCLKEHGHAWAGRCHAPGSSGQC